MRLLCMVALCALVFPVLALRTPAASVLAVGARAVRFRAWCVVCMCSTHLRRGAFVDVSDITPLVDPGDMTRSHPSSVT